MLDFVKSKMAAWHAYCLQKCFTPAYGCCAGQDDPKQASTDVKVIAIWTKNGQHLPISETDG
jgi:hypothetical protein